MPNLKLNILNFRHMKKIKPFICGCVFYEIDSKLNYNQLILHNNNMGFEMQGDRDSTKVSDKMSRRKHIP